MIPSRPPLLARVLFGCLCAAGIPAVAAATFSVSPTKVELDAQHRSAILTFKNDGQAPLRMQVRPMRWKMAPDGTWQLTPSDDLIVTPELLEVAPGKSVQMRVGSLHDAGASEVSYRLLIDELPNLDGAASTARPEIKVRTRVSLPIFLEPSDPTRTPVLRSASLRHRVLTLRLGNDGTQRLDAQGIKLSILDRAGHVVGSHDQVANYVLAGATESVTTTLPAKVCARAASVSVTWPGLAASVPARPINTGAEACGGKP